MLRVCGQKSWQRRNHYLERDEKMERETGIEPATNSLEG